MMLDRLVVSMSTRKIHRPDCRFVDGVGSGLFPFADTVLVRILPPCGSCLAPTDVRRYIDTHARHGFVYRLGAHWILEHCTDGEWYACPLKVSGDADERAVNMAAMRDLKRVPHRGPLPELLRGSDHR